MKMEGKRSVIEIQDDDGDFFSQVAAAEAAALASSKRRRITSSLNAGVRSPLANISKSKKEISAAQNDGLYMAALKGNQSIVREAAAAKGNDAVFGSAGGGGGNSCFKCGKSGHWARDCDSSAGGGGAGGNFGNSDPPMPEKSCPCGLGICTVLTANTEKNRGRKFYKCPLRQENGGCGFFEWCDNASAGNNYSMAGGNGNHTSDSSFPGLPCPCGAGLCLILTAKTGKNIGQQFYKCPANQGSSCGFFKWCNENTTSVSAPVSTLRAANNSSGTNNRSYGVRTGSSFYNTSDTNNTGYCVRTGSSFCNTSDTNNTGYGVRTGSSCFKCGKEGHWARDCSAPSLNPPAEMGGKSVSSGTCYKCGKPGHWSRDCSFA